MHEETEKAGLVFQHFSYVLEKDVRFKQEYYGYKNAVKEWKKLQEDFKNNPEGVYKLSEYLSWIKDDAKASKFKGKNLFKEFYLEKGIVWKNLP
jgi:hypothetical protein